MASARSRSVSEEPVCPGWVAAHPIAGAEIPLRPIRALQVGGLGTLSALVVLPILFIGTIMYFRVVLDHSVAHFTARQHLLATPGASTGSGDRHLIVRRFALLWLIAAAPAVSSCAETPTSPSTEGPTVAFAVAARGPAQAFDRADRLSVQVTSGDVVALDTVIPFSSGGADTRVRLRMPRDPGDGPVTINAELRLGGEPLFRGGASGVTISATSGPVEITLEPVIVRIEGPAQMPTITTLGGTVQLTAAAVMATGDTVPGVAFTFRSLDATTLSVDGQGVVRGLGEGDGRIEIRSGAISALVTVRVRAIVVSVELEPEAHTLRVGARQQYTFVARDQAGNALVRTAAWSSSNEDVVTIDENGLAIGTGVGAARIEAVVENVTGSASVVVIRPVPAAPTNLVATPSGNTVRLTWQDNATDETSYEVRRAPSGGSQPVVVAQLGPNVTMYGETPGPDLVLDYYVAACHPDGCSEPATVTTRTAPRAPLNLDGSVDMNTGNYTLTWEDVSTTETHFVIEINLDYDLAEPWSQEATAPANSTTYTSNLGFRELAYFRVFACNSTGCSAPSNLVFLYAYSFGPALAPKSVAASVRVVR